MKKLVEKVEIIGRKLAGESSRKIAKSMGINRETVNKYWNEYITESEKLRVTGGIGAAGGSGEDARDAQAKLFAAPVYRTPERPPRKYTDEIDTFLREIIDSEKKKNRLLGAGHKQKLTNVQIYEKVREQGFDICIATINANLARLRKRMKECYIRQEYDFGQRVEYDFGEVKLIINGKLQTCHMAVFCAPASGFRWLYLYTNQKKGVFLDSHVRFFEKMGGVFREVVYDNMKNVVHKFLGKNEKELDKDLITMSVYYGFKPNVTNAYSGNEKGSVERSVEVLRKKIFADNLKFSSLKAAEEFAERELEKINAKSEIELDKKALLPYKPPYELAEIGCAKVNKYGTICCLQNFYSVPDTLVGQTVQTRRYHDEIRIYHNNEKIACHALLPGKHKYSVKFEHFLRTFEKKPLAITNSAALKAEPRLKAIFDRYYANKPRKFIEIYTENKNRSLPEICEIFEKLTFVGKNVDALDIPKPISDIDIASNIAMTSYNSLVIGGVRSAS
jgi:transposase